MLQLRPSGIMCKSFVKLSSSSGSISCSRRSTGAIFDSSGKRRNEFKIFLNEFKIFPCKLEYTDDDAFLTQQKLIYRMVVKAITFIEAISPFWTLMTLLR